MSDRRDEKPPVGFEATKRRAESYLENPSRARELLRKATAKAAQKRHVLTEVWVELMALFRLFRAWISGEYRGVTWQTMLLVATAILYFVMPFDVIPDFLAMWGFLDDAAIIGYVVGAIRQELERFLEWESAGEERPTDEVELDQ